MRFVLDAVSITAGSGRKHSMRQSLHAYSHFCFERAAAPNRHEKTHQAKQYLVLDAL